MKILKRSSPKLVPNQYWINGIWLESIIQLLRILYGSDLKNKLWSLKSSFLDMSKCVDQIYDVLSFPTTTAKAACRAHHPQRVWAKSWVGPLRGARPQWRLENTFALKSLLLWRVHIFWWGPHSRRRAGCTQRHGSNNPHWIGKHWVFKYVYIIDDNNFKFFFQYDNISQAGWKI